MSSRVARKPIEIPKGVEVTINGKEVSVKGSKGTLSHTIPECVAIAQNDNEIVISPSDPNDAERSTNALAGTTRALISNNIIGVSEGYEKKLTLVGVGYRAQIKGKVLNLTLGFSHPVDHPIPEGLSIEVGGQKQDEIIIKGIDKQVVGQVAADIRAYRPPEPYKGKGVRYSDEQIIKKEVKKK